MLYHNQEPWSGARRPASIHNLCSQCPHVLVTLDWCRKPRSKKPAAQALGNLDTPWWKNACKGLLGTLHNVILNYVGPGQYTNRWWFVSIFENFTPRSMEGERPRLLRMFFFCLTNFLFPLRSLLRSASLRKNFFQDTASGSQTLEGLEVGFLQRSSGDWSNYEIKCMRQS